MIKKNLKYLIRLVNITMLIFIIVGVAKGVLVFGAGAAPAPCRPGPCGPRSPDCSSYKRYAYQTCTESMSNGCFPCGTHSYLCYCSYDFIAPTITTNYSSANPTPGVWRLPSFYISTSAADTGGSGLRSYSPGITVSQNGTYTFSAYDGVSNTSSTVVNVPNIDRTAPTITLTPSTTSWTNKDINITVQVHDTGSGTKRLWLDNHTIIDTNTARKDLSGNLLDNHAYPYTFDESWSDIGTHGRTTPSGPDENVGSNDTRYFSVKENGTYIMHAIDFWGHQTDRSITISNIDKIQPDNLNFAPVYDSNKELPDGHKTANQWPAGLEVLVTSDDNDGYDGNNNHGSTPGNEPYDRSSRDPATGQQSNNTSDPNGAGNDNTDDIYVANGTYAHSGIQTIGYMWSTTYRDINNDPTSSSRNDSFFNSMTWSSNNVVTPEQLCTSNSNTKWYLYVRVKDNAGNEYTDRRQYIIMRPHIPKLLPINKANDSTDVQGKSIRIVWDRQGNYRKTVYQIYRADNHYEVFNTVGGALTTYLGYNPGSPGNLDSGATGMRSILSQTNQDDNDYIDGTEYGSTPLDYNRQYHYQVQAKIQSNILYTSTTDTTSLTNETTLNEANEASYPTTHFSLYYSKERDAYTKCNIPGPLLLDTKSPKNVQLTWDSIDLNPENVTQYRIVRNAAVIAVGKNNAGTDVEKKSITRYKEADSVVDKGTNPAGMGVTTPIWAKRVYTQVIGHADQTIQGSSDKITVHYLQDTNPAYTGVDPLMICPEVLTLPNDATYSNKILRINDNTTPALTNPQTSPVPTRWYYAYNDTAVTPNTNYVYSIGAVNGDGILTIRNADSIGVTKDVDLSKTTLPDITISNIKTMVNGKQISGSSRVSTGQEITVSYDIDSTLGPDKYDEYLVYTDLNDNEHQNTHVIAKKGSGFRDIKHSGGIYDMYVSDSSEMAKYADDNSKGISTIERTLNPDESMKHVIASSVPNAVPNKVSVQYLYRYYKKQADSTVGSDLINRIRIIGVRAEDNIKGKAGYVPDSTTTTTPKTPLVINKKLLLFKFDTNSVSADKSALTIRTVQ
jgi:hypothetical protein